jgi:hypothetical protein
LINHISEKLKVTPNSEVIIVLIKWLEVLHSIQNVNILPSVPKFLEKLLINIESKNNVNQKSEVSKKSLEQLQMFIDEFHNPMARSVKLDKQIINKLLTFLLKDKELQRNLGAGGGGTGNQSKMMSHSNMIILEPSKMEALIWLRDFLKFYQEDYLQW